MSFRGRSFHLEESTTTTDGARTTFIERMTPGTTVPPHWHTRFNDVFDLVSGNMTVYSCDKPDLELLERSGHELEVGKKFVIPPGQCHSYIVGDQGATLRVILTPANAEFETILKIMNGMRREGELDDISNSLIWMAVAMELADANLFGPTGEILVGVRKDKVQEIEELRTRLLTKYDTQEQLEALLND